MNTELLKQDLYEYISGLEIVDCHEHIIDESAAIKKKTDFTLLVDQYNQGDFLSAGMKLEELKLFYHPDTDPEYKWRLFEKWWPYVEDTSYAKATRLVLRHDFGVDALTKENYREISEKLQARKQPGYYREIFRDCGIRVALNDDLISYAERFPRNTDLLKRVVRVPDVPDGAQLVQPGSFYTGVTGLEDLHERARAYIRTLKELDNKGVKLMLGLPYESVTAAQAAAELKRLRQSQTAQRSIGLFWYTVDLVLDEAAREDLPVSVHTGYWEDFRGYSPEGYIPLFFRHPDVRFDLFHLGYPYVKSSLLLAKTFPNVWIDLCWTYVISQQFAKDALCQIVDLIPRNKVHGFGGDFIDVERIYGHRAMMNETMSAALAAKAADGTLSPEKARLWARSMLVDNPAAFYHV